MFTFLARPQGNEKAKETHHKENGLYLELTANRFSCLLLCTRSAKKRFPKRGQHFVFPVQPWHRSVNLSQQTFLRLASAPEIKYNEVGNAT